MAVTITVGNDRITRSDGRYVPFDDEVVLWSGMCYDYNSLEIYTAASKDGIIRTQAVAVHADHGPDFNFSEIRGKVLVTIRISENACMQLVFAIGYDNAWRCSSWVRPIVDGIFPRDWGRWLYV